MKILLDECVPWPMHRVLIDHECTTAQKRGWDALQNGALIALAETEFDVFITCDQNIRYQQNLQDRQIAIIELSTNDLRRIVASGELILASIQSLTRGAYLRLEVP